MLRWSVVSPELRKTLINMTSHTLLKQVVPEPAVFLLLLCQLNMDPSTCVHPVVGLQLVLQAEFLPAAITFVGLLPGVDAFVALQRVLVSEAAPAELALVRMVAC